MDGQINLPSGMHTKNNYVALFQLLEKDFVQLNLSYLHIAVNIDIYFWANNCFI